MMPGIGANAENIVDFKAKLGRSLQYCRVFMQTQDWSPTDARIKEALAAHARGETPVITMKVGSVTNAINGSDDARQARILNGFKSAGVVDLVWGVLHEPEDDVASGSFTSAQWLQMQSHMIPLANTILHPSGGKTISILMSYTSNPSSGRNPQDYHVPEVDLQGWDIYERGGSAAGSTWATVDPSTKSVDTLWGPCLELSKGWGKPTLVCEFGVLRREADTTGAERGKYFRNVAAYPRISEVKGIMYYEVGPPRYNYAFRTEQAGVDGFLAIADAGGTVTPPGETDAQKITRLTAELATANAALKTCGDTNTALIAARDALQVKIDKVKADVA